MLSSDFPGVREAIATTFPVTTTVHRSQPDQKQANSSSDHARGNRRKRPRNAVTVWLKPYRTRWSTTAP